MYVAINAVDKEDWPEARSAIQVLAASYGRQATK